MVNTNRKQQSVTIVLALLAGLLGGVIASQFFSGLRAFAEMESISHGSVITEGLLLLDGTGRLRATLGPSGDGGVALSMLDSKGVPRLTAKASDNTTSLSLWDANGTLQARLKAPASSLVLYGENGRAIWSAP